MLDEVSKEDGAKNSQSETEDLLDTVDQKQPTCTSGEGGDMLDDVSTKKSADMNGKQIPTLRDMMAIRKSGRPDAISSVNGDIERPELGKITKSQSSPVRMGRGVDPKKVTENDWNEYNLFKSRQTF